MSGREDEGDPGGPAPDEDGLVDVWERWTGDEVPFHRYCVIVPETPPPVPGVDAPAPEGRPPPLSYCPPLARWALRHTPFLVLLAVIGHVGLTSGGVIVDGVAALAALASVRIGLMAAGVLLWAAVLVVIVRRSEVLTGVGDVRGVVVYGLAGTFTAGLVLRMSLAASETALGLPASAEAALLSFPFDFFWMLLLGGILVYDGMLRTENMFTRLHWKRPRVVDDDGAYWDFVGGLREHLVHPTTVPSRLRSLPLLSRLPETVRTAYLFAALFVAPFFLIWWARPPAAYADAGPLVYGFLALVPTVLDFFLVVVFFQFLVLVAHFHRLLTEHAPERAGDASFALVYTPGHPDGYAGFRDFGKFSTRVNTILVIGGVYVASRLYVGGLETFPGLNAGAGVPLFLWTVNHLAPLAVYALAVAVWLYLSFWQLHKTMRRGRRRAIERRLRDPDAGRELQDAPVWPVNNRLLVAVLSMDLLPLVSLLPFLPG